MVIFLDIRALLFSIPGVIIAVTIHEYVKSLTAYQLGDKAIKEQKRLFPNPFRHIDPLGAIFMLLFGYGWANPVRIKVFPPAIRKKAITIIVLMPFFVNVLVGAALEIARGLIILHFAGQPGANLNQLITILEILRQAAVFNISFAFFNLLPIFPLDGMMLITAYSPIAGMKLAQSEGALQIGLIFAIIFGIAARIFDRIVILLLGALSF